MGDTNAHEQAWLESLASIARARPLTLAFSGGLDSSFLLASLARAGLAPQLRVVHVDHGLQLASADWAEHCRQRMAELGVSGAVERVLLAPGANLEARARRARYAALARHVSPGGWLVLAHHRDDQAETVLLRMMRGASVHGLAAMRVHQQRDGLHLWRPMLGCSRQWIAETAKRWSLQWLEDPSNAEDGPDRNFLRQRVLPLLNQRWAAHERLASVAQSAEEAAALAADLASQDARRVRSGEGLSVSALLGLPDRRRNNLLAWWLRERGGQVAERAMLGRLCSEVLLAGEDREPRLVMGEQVWCRYRDQLFLLAARELEPLVDQAQWHPGEMPELFLGPVHLQVGSDAAQWRIRSPDQPFTVRAAAGGERLFRNGMHQQVSELWRQAGIPPWQRRRLPLMLLGDEVVAAANIGVADNWQPESAEAGLGIQIEYQ